MVALFGVCCAAIAVNAVQHASLGRDIGLVGGAIGFVVFGALLTRDIRQKRSHVH